eukprot:jgi/Mesen1/3470/ME000195S02619
MAAPSADQHKIERKKAAAIVISLDLVTAAKRQLQLLQAVDRFPCLYQGPAVAQAIRRLRAPCASHMRLDKVEPAQQEQLDRVDSTAPTKVAQLVPPLDVHWVWHVHRLAPVAYARDCQRMFGCVLDCPPAAPAPTDQQELVSMRLTRELWAARFPQEPFDLDLAGMSSQLAALEGVDPGQRPGKSAGPSLVHAWSHHGPAAPGGGQVSQPYMYDDHFLAGALERYRKFLHVVWAAGGKVFCVPTYDIDVMWHAHQLAPACYARDTTAVLGRVLDHDDSDATVARSAATRLHEGFTQTAVLWERLYGAAYGVGMGTGMGTVVMGIPMTPAPPPLPPRDVNEAWGLQKRFTAQVCIAVIEAVDLPKISGQFFVKARLMSKCDAMRLRTPLVPAPPAAGGIASWRTVWTLQCELAARGVTLQLKGAPAGALWRRMSRVLGECHVGFDELLASPTLSFDKLMPVRKERASPKKHADATRAAEKPKSPSPSGLLRVGASISPPLQAPYLLLMIPSESIDDSGDRIAWRSIVPAGAPRGTHVPQKGRWMTRQHEVETVEQRKVSDPDVERTWGTCANHLPSRASWTLSVTRDPRNGHWARATSIQLAIEGQAEYPVRLVVGRWLQYEVPGGRPEHEEGYVTVIRYSSHAPQGKATCLLNWRTGGIEVHAEEDVVLMLGVATALQQTMFDFQGANRSKPNRRQPRRRNFRKDDEWGAVVIESETRPGGGMRSGQRAPLDHWYSYDMLMWNNVMLYNAVSSACGGGCGGGGCNSASGCGGVGGCGGGGGGDGGGGGCGGGCGGCGG